MERTQGLRTPGGERIAVVSGLRTPFARQASAFHGVPALELGRSLVTELLLRSDLDPALVELLVFGQVIQMPEAPNIAREIVLASPLGAHTDAYSVSRACATSFQAVACVAEALQCGQVDIGIAGGADSASVLPIGVSKALARSLLDLSKARTLRQRWQALRGLRLRDLKPVPPAIAEYSTGLTMGDTAEQMAKSHHISRAEQDAYAHGSHQKAAAAWESGKLDDEVALTLVPPFKQVLERDNCVRFDSELASYARLKPAFDRAFGSVTAGNASPMTDGAAALLLMREGRARELGLPVLGFLRSYAFAALPVASDMLLGPVYATPRALIRAGCRLADLTLIDMHEAFAAQVLVNLKLFADADFGRTQLGLPSALGEIDAARLNVLGGSLAYGHPFAATGARMITQTLRELARRGGGLALTTACAAGGLGAAMIWEVA